MKKGKMLFTKATAIALMSMLTLSSAQVPVFAYGEHDVSKSTFKTDTDNSEDFKTWLANEWSGGKMQFADSGKIALTPGTSEKNLNFAWYSAAKGTPAVMIWKDGQKSSAKIVKGQAADITAENWQGSKYAASNKVTIENYFESSTQYYYQYTDNYTDGGGVVWSDTFGYKTGAFDSFSVILTGDPQVGASGSSSDASANDASAARDTYNWNKTMQQALKTSPNAAFLLSAGDQIDKSGATKENDKKTRESEYAGYLYPSVFRSLPIASTIGNHDMNGSDYSAHFNNPNSADKLGATAAGSDYYFTYGDVLFISLNSNNRNQEEHRTLMKKAVESAPNAAWKVVIFHSDIYGSGQPHADTDASANRIIFAPLMDEFDIDVCLTGHDHTFSRSYQVLDGNVVDYDISSGSVTNPEGTLYITTGSGSGSKYYNLLNYTPYYIAERTNACLPSFSTMDFTSGSLTIKTYDYNGNKYADDFTIKKTSDLVSVDEVIANAEAVLADTKTEYTEESINALKSSLDTLKKMQAAYTTATDPMIADITKNYGTENDRVSGYGSVKNAEDKDTIASGVANRFKKGVSTLLDKTIYCQIDEGKEIADAKFPVVDGAALENAKTEVVKAINGLTATGDGSGEGNGNGSAAGDEGNKAPNTGDSALGIYVYGSLLVLSLGAAVIVFRKREELCEK